MKKLHNWFKKFNQDTKATWFMLDLSTRYLIAFMPTIILFVLIGLVAI